MNFYFAAIGPRKDVLGQLKNADTRGNLLGETIRNAIADAIALEPEIDQPGFEHRYNISCSGHSGDLGVPLTLNVTIQSRHAPKADSS